MLITDAEAELRSFAKLRGADVSAPADAREVAETWLAFYEQVRVEGVTKKEGAWPDALLFEWGRREAFAGYYDACFYLNFTRQFISDEGEDDDAMSQLVWQLEYEPSERLVQLGGRSEWCDGLLAFHSFRQFVLSSKVLQAIAGSCLNKTELYLTGV